MNIGLGGVSQPINDNVAVGVNPITGTGGIQLGGSVGQVHLGAGIGVGAGGVGVTPSVIIGNDPANATGGQIGGAVGSAAGSVFGPVGSAAGSLVGSAVGSVVGGEFGGGKGQAQMDRDRLRSQLQSTGFLDNKGEFLLPDGASFNLGIDGNGGRHNWADPTRRTDSHKDTKDLSAYDTDYTNDLDYLASMGGISLSRLLFGGKNTAIDQIGSQIGNGTLGKNGYGSKFDQQTFNSLSTNMRSVWAKAGIHNKEDALSLAATAFAQHRINDTDYATIQQTANTFFDGDFNGATQLMSGRWKGIDHAASTPVPSQTPANRPGRIYSPVISPEEAFMSVDPFFSEFRKRFPTYKTPGGLQTANTLGQVASGVAAAGTLINGIRNSGLGSFIHGIYNNLTGSNAFSGGNVTGGAGVNDTGSFGGNVSGGAGVGGSAPDVSGGIGNSGTADTFDASAADSLPDFSFNF